METGALGLWSWTFFFFFFNKGWDARLACDCSLALSRWRWEIWLTERRTVPSGVMGIHSVCSGCVCWSGLGWIWTGWLRSDTCMSAFFFFPCVAQVLLQYKGTEKASDRAIRRGWRVPLVFVKGIIYFLVSYYNKSKECLKFVKILPDPLPQFTF